MLPFQFRDARCYAIARADLSIPLATVTGGTLSSLKGVTFLRDNNLSSVVRSQVLIFFCNIGFSYDSITGTKNKNREVTLCTLYQCQPLKLYPTATATTLMCEYLTLLAK